MLVPNIEYKSILSGCKNENERNIRFLQLDDQSKRLEIAWDALNLVMNDKLQPSDGCYWNAYLADNTINITSNLTEIRKFLLNKLGENCEVCQRGAIMVSTIRAGHCFDIDSIDKENIVDGNECKARAGFSIESMWDMENEYENNYFNHPYQDNTKEKMMNILCNILVNGDFNTNDRTDYLIEV